MNDARHDAWTAYVRDLADRLLLRDWEVTVSREAADPGKDATVYLYHNENRADIRFADAFWGFAPEKRREVTVHEILHCHFARQQRVLDALDEIHEGDKDIQLATKLFGHETEIINQRFARILAPTLPLLLEN